MTDHKLTLQKRDALQSAFNTQSEKLFVISSYLALYDALALIADLQQRIVSLDEQYNDLMDSGGSQIARLQQRIAALEAAAAPAPVVRYEGDVSGTPRPLPPEVMGRFYALRGVGDAGVVYTGPNPVTAPPVLWEGEGVLDEEIIGASDYTGDPGRSEFVVILKADDIPADMGQRVHIVITAVS